MHRLFIKIFLWFWIAMALVWSAFLIPTEFSRDDELRARFAALTDQRLVLSGRVAVGLMRGPGMEAFEQFKVELEEQGAPYPFVFDVTGLEITGREVPAAAQDAAMAVLDPDGSGRIITREDAVWIALAFERRNETFAVAQRLPSRLDFPARPFWTLWLRWALILFISGLVCYAMARYLIGPVSTLSAATRALAEGDLSVRVSTELEARHDELSDLGQDFDHMASQIGALLENQRQLLSDISHELRSPLARLSVALGIARQRAGEGAEDSLNRIEQESERLNAMIGELLTLTRLDDPASLPAPVLVDLENLVESIVGDAHYEAQARSRQVVWREKHPAQVRGYAELLHRAIENVIRNAIRYTPENSEVEIDLVPVSEGDRVALEVRDHGPGVPPESLAAVFQPFYRVDDARERASGGTGLGLSISERAVRAHGGAISAANATDGGLIVRIVLPAARAV